MSGFKKIQVRKVTPRIGAEVSGVDLSSKGNPETLEEIRRALHENLVLFFRDQPLDHAQHKVFGRAFGDLMTHPFHEAPEGHPEIMTIRADANTKRVVGEQWHSDLSCDPKPPLGSILRLDVVPECGGDTAWVNMYEAYDTLSPGMQAMLCQLTAVHSPDGYSGTYGSQTVHEKRLAQAEHPVIRTHPATGRRALYVNPGFTSHIKGIPAAESEAILAFLFKHIGSPIFQCRFRWARNSIAFWDNRCTLHQALFDYHPHTRVGYRVTIAGDAPFFKP
jgi:taurine dioxygenase